MTEAFFKAVFVALAASVLYALAAGWAFMLAVGIAHHEWIPQLPTIGFGWACLIIWLLMVPIMIYTTKNSD